MKISKDCGFDTTGKCFVTNASDFRRATDYIGDFNTSGAYKIILADGTSLSFEAFGDFNDGHIIYADIDGPNKGSSMGGRDIFFYRISQKGKLGYKSMTSPCDSDADCLKWVLENDNMDYLKTNTEGKCPNGKVLNEQNISCK